jgi:hypothetical protein
VAFVESIPNGWRIVMYRRLGVQGSVPLIQTGTNLLNWDPAAPSHISFSESGGIEEIWIDIDTAEESFFSRAAVSNE